MTRRVMAALMGKARGKCNGDETATANTNGVNSPGGGSGLGSNAKYLTVKMGT